MTLFVVLFIVSVIVEINGHGRLMEPPARNAMWRYGFKNPVNYNDNELYCGGFVVHYIKNKGKCGVCGDDFRRKVPREHEARGIFANGIIARRYVVGQQITIVADLTTNHKGWMEVKICPNNDPYRTVTQECLDSHPLNIVGQGTHKFVIPKESKKVETFTWTVQLPEFMTCSQCIIQWTYFAGNTWGQCMNGSESVGCGDQETFINCADVEIYSNVPVKDPVDVPNPWTIFYRGNKFSNIVKANDSVPANELKPLVVRSQLCIPVGKFKDTKGMKDWCRINCLKYPPECPPEMCRCVHDCVAVGEFAKLPDADIFCHQNCLKYPSHCPEERCKCT